jgi:hypothetical protein
MAMSKEDHGKCITIVQNLCIDPKKTNYGQQIRVAKQLLGKIPEMEFWENFAKAESNKKGSLVFYLTEVGKKQLGEAQKKVEVLKEWRRGKRMDLKKEQPKLGDEILFFDENFEESQKRKTILDIKNK